MNKHHHRSKTDYWRCGRDTVPLNVTSHYHFLCDNGFAMQVYMKLSPSPKVERKPASAQVEQDQQWHSSWRSSTCLQMFYISEKNKVVVTNFSSFASKLLLGYPYIQLELRKVQTLLIGECCEDNWEDRLSPFAKFIYEESGIMGSLGDFPPSKRVTFMLLDLLLISLCLKKSHCLSLHVWYFQNQHHVILWTNTNLWS